MQDVSEFLMHETSEITDAALQRISNIVIRHLNNSSSVGVVGLGGSIKSQQKLHNSIHQLVSHDDILTNLFSYDRRSHDKFLEKLENYVNSLFVASSTVTTQNNSIDDDQKQQSPLSIPSLSASSVERMNLNEAVSVLRKIRENDQLNVKFDSSSFKPQSTVKMSTANVDELTITTTHSDKISTPIGAKNMPDGHRLAGMIEMGTGDGGYERQSSPSNTPQPVHILPMNNNQDLAEADQICSNNDDHTVNGAIGSDNNIYLMEEDFINNASGHLSAENIGAVGGLVGSQLPDLANVTQAPSRIISFEDESVSFLDTNAEVERITSQSFEMATVPPNNCLNDIKPKNQ